MMREQRRDCIDWRKYIFYFHAPRSQFDDLDCLVCLLLLFFRMTFFSVFRFFASYILCVYWCWSQFSANESKNWFDDNLIFNFMNIQIAFILSMIAIFGFLENPHQFDGAFLEKEVCWCARPFFDFYFVRLKLYIVRVYDWFCDDFWLFDFIE